MKKHFIYMSEILTNIGGAANYMTPYTYAALPQATGMSSAIASGIHGLSPYQSSGGLQEARLQWYLKCLRNFG